MCEMHIWNGKSLISSTFILVTTKFGENNNLFLKAIHICIIIFLGGITFILGLLFALIVFVLVLSLMA